MAEAGEVEEVVLGPVVVWVAGLERRVRLGRVSVVREAETGEAEGASTRTKTLMGQQLYVRSIQSRSRTERLGDEIGWVGRGW